MARNISEEKRLKDSEEKEKITTGTEEEEEEEEETLPDIEEENVVERVVSDNALEGVSITSVESKAEESETQMTLEELVETAAPFPVGWILKQQIKDFKMQAQKWDKAYNATKTFFLN
ncbi:hypothetical protein KAT92_01645 [Candidatus Babeliales bacterium]|nr:hypothetical protein [Candidatus Babeliales bacterium]